MIPIQIALKDIKQAFRSRAALIFMFVIPLLITGMFYLIFGVAGGEDESFAISPVALVVVNQDREGEYGDQLLESLQADSLHDLLDITELASAAEARKLVDRGKSAVALIIPDNFSAAVLGQENSAELELYQDPILTLGPGIAELIISQIMDGYSGSRIAVNLTVDQLQSAGEPVTEAEILAVVSQYTSQIAEDGGVGQLVSVETPAGEISAESFDPTSFIGFIMGAMMVFYAFFAGANTAMSILHEDERGTLPRLFTTPITQAQILNGKFIATTATVLIQVLVLLGFGRFVFGIRWGSALNLALVCLAITTTAASFGILINSLIKNTKQAGMVFGGVVTVTGMMGMSNIFVMGAPGAAQLVNKLALFVPQGWAMRGLQLSLDGAGPAEVAPFAAVSLIWALMMFLIGNTRFKRRYL